jgi:PAS domain S-box-containing protein
MTMHIYVCSNLYPEVVSLQNSFSSLRIEVHEFNSFCGHPMLTISDFDDERLKNDGPVLIIGGVCLNNLQQRDFSETVSLVRYHHSSEFLLDEGVAEYFIRDGAYLVSSGWLMRWKENLKIWGFDQATAEQFFQESCRYILLLDTGIDSQWKVHLEEFGTFIHTQVRRMEVGLTRLSQLLGSHMPITATPHNQEQLLELAHLRKQVSDYGMGMDLIHRLSQCSSEQEVLENVILLMYMLFAPQSLYLLKYNMVGKPVLMNQIGIEVEEDEVMERLKNARGAYEKLASGTGFRFGISYGSQLLARVEVDQIQFPQYIDHYIGLALRISEVCGITISNTRAYEQVSQQKEKLAMSYRQLEESEEKYSRLVHNATDMIYRMELPSGEYSYVSPSSIEIFGYDPGVFYHKPQLIRELIHPDWVDYFAMQWENLLQGNMPPTYEYQIVDPKGQERWINQRNRLITDEDNKPVAIEGIVSDITYRKQIELELAESERRLKTLFSNLPGMAYRCLNDADWTMHFVSQGSVSLLGYYPNELVQSRVLTYNSLIYPEDRNKVHAVIQKAIERGTSFNLEYRLVTREKQIKWVWEIGRSVLGDNGKVIALEGFITDITERITYEKTLQDQQEHIQIISRLLWHDVTNGLAVIKSAIRLFKAQKQPERLDDALHQIDKSVDLIKRMRRLSSTLHEIESLQPVDVVNMLDATLVDYPLSYRISGKATVLADDALLSIFENLLLNIVRHAQATHVEITIKKYNQRCLISICDNGIGIPDLYKEKVFEQSVTLGKSGNTGIGLFIVRKTVERYGGTVVIENNSPHGTCFRLSLPLAQEDAIADR